MSQNAGNGHFRAGHKSSKISDSPLKVLDLRCLVLVIAATAALNELVCLKITKLKETLFLILTLSLYDIGQLEHKKSHHAALYRWFLKLKA